MEGAGEKSGLRNASLVAAFSATRIPYNVRTDLTGLGRPARRDVDELAAKGPDRISRPFGGLYFTTPAPVTDVGVVVFRNGIQDRLGRCDRLQYGQTRPAEIRPVCRLVADHCHCFDRRPSRIGINRGIVSGPTKRFLVVVAGSDHEENLRGAT